MKVKGTPGIILLIIFHVLYPLSLFLFINNIEKRRAENEDRKTGRFQRCLLLLPSPTRQKVITLSNTSALLY